MLMLKRKFFQSEYFLDVSLSTVVNRCTNGRVNLKDLNDLLNHICIWLTKTIRKLCLLSHNSDDENSDSAHTSGSCVVYATINEKATGATVTVCRGRKRKRHVYTSTTNSVEIHFDEQIGNENDISYFVMEYAGIFIEIISFKFRSLHINVLYYQYDLCQNHYIHIHMHLIRLIICIPFVCTYVYVFHSYVHMYMYSIRNDNSETCQYPTVIPIFLAFGCTDPSIPDQAQVHWEGDHATIICPTPGDVTWEITCRDGQWHGPHGNCSTGA